MELELLPEPTHSVYITRFQMSDQAGLGIDFCSLITEQFPVYENTFPSYRFCL